jgi:hypothetical protein
MSIVNDDVLYSFRAVHSELGNILKHLRGRKEGRKGGRESKERDCIVRQQEKDKRQDKREPSFASFLTFFVASRPHVCSSYALKLETRHFQSARLKKAEKAEIKREKAEKHNALLQEHAVNRAKRVIRLPKKHLRRGELLTRGQKKSVRS